jgi:hypothetical protein
MSLVNQLCLLHDYHIPYTFIDTMTAKFTVFRPNLWTKDPHLNPAEA